MNFRGIPCPACTRKGLKHPDHAHAQGYKEYSRVKCRFCEKSWRLTDAMEQHLESTRETKHKERDHV